MIDVCISNTTTEVLLGWPMTLVSSTRLMIFVELCSRRMMRISRAVAFGMGWQGSDDPGSRGTGAVPGYLTGDSAVPQERQRVAVVMSRVAPARAVTLTQPR